MAGGGLPGNQVDAGVGGDEHELAQDFTQGIQHAIGSGACPGGGRCTSTLQSFAGGGPPGTAGTAEQGPTTGAPNLSSGSPAARPIRRTRTESPASCPDPAVGLQLGCGDRDSIDEEHQVDRFVAGLRVVDLPHHPQPDPAVKLQGGRVQVVRRPELAHLQRRRTVLETLAQHPQRPALRRQRGVQNLHQPIQQLLARLCLQHGRIGRLN